VQTITVSDETAPTFQSAPSDIVLNADAGGCTATLTAAEIGTPVADDNCDAVVDISFARSDGAPNIDDPFDAVDSPITITWTATDNCGNFAQHLQSVTVNGVQDLTATVVLAGVDAGASLTRCITFVPKDGTSCADVEDLPVEFTGNPATGVAVFSVLCGDWTEVCAKDEQHTKWDTQGLITVGAEFETDAPLMLEGGDTDNDSDIDINDVTLLLAQYGTLAQAGGCPWDGTRDADFSNNGSIGVEDYTFLTTYWLTASSCACSAPPLMGPGDTDVVELKPLQTRTALTADTPAFVRQADLNNDGVIDYLDVRVFEANNGLPQTLSEKLRRTQELQAAPLGPDDVAGF
jgi:hypothetical protein